MELYSSDIFIHSIMKSIGFETRNLWTTNLKKTTQDKLDQACKQRKRQHVLVLCLLLGSFLGDSNKSTVRPWPSANWIIFNEDKRHFWKRILQRMNSFEFEIQLALFVFQSAPNHLSLRRRLTFEISQFGDGLMSYSGELNL